MWFLRYERGTKRPLIQGGGILRSCSPFPVHTEQLVATKNNELCHQLRIWSQLARGQRAQMRLRMPRSGSSLQPTHQLVCCHVEAIAKPLTGRTGRAAVQHTSVWTECGCVWAPTGVGCSRDWGSGSPVSQPPYNSTCGCWGSGSTGGFAELQLLNENEFEAFCMTMEPSLGSVMHPEVNCYLSQALNNAFPGDHGCSRRECQNP